MGNDPRVRQESAAVPDLDQLPVTPSPQPAEASPDPASSDDQRTYDDQRSDGGDGDAKHYVPL